MMRIAFLGTPDFAVPSLADILSNGHDVVKVYTQPPRPAGRGKRLQKSPVHQFCDVMGVSVETPEKFRRSSVIDGFEALDLDVACVVAYGHILPKRALEAPRYGCLNLHASKLPRWRGAAPVQRAIMSGDRETACQIMQMDVGLDTGDVLLSETVAIGARETAGELFGRLSRIGANMWPRTLAALERGGLSPTPQVGEPTYAEKIDKSEARIDWSRSAHGIDCHIRGLNPMPGAWCEIGGKRVKIHTAEPLKTPIDIQAVPGEIVSEDLIIQCGEGQMKLLTVQPSGKPSMSADAFLQGTPVPAGTVLT